MSSLIDMLLPQLQGETMKKIGNQIGADESTTRGAISASLPLLINALSRNASDENGANELSVALSRDHDGSILDNLQGYLNKSDTSAGEGILRHVLGSQQGTIQKGLGKSSGLDSSSVGKLMGMLAPVLMGTLGKVKRENNLDAQSLAGFLGKEKEEMERTEPQAMGFLGNLLDTDKDGDVDAGDLLKHGMNIFSKFFRGN